MKLISLLVSCLLSLPALAGPISSTQGTQIRPFDWQPVIGINPKAPFSAYYDRNSMAVNKEENGIYSSGTILLVAKQPVPILVNQKTILTRSLMKLYVVECGSGLSVAHTEFYFTVPVPGLETIPVARFERTPDQAETLSKDSMLYHIFCPVYI